MGAKEPPLLEGQIERDKGTDEEVARDVFQVSGSVRWFDPSKGFGFLVPNQDLPDVLLHVTCLRRDGFLTVREGARIVCGVAHGERLASDPHSRRGHCDRSPSVAVASTGSCCRRPRERLGNSPGEVVQSTAWVWVPNPWPRDSGHLCACGDAKTLRPH